MADLGEGAGGGGGGPPLFWVKKEEMTEEKMAGRTSKSRAFYLHKQDKFEIEYFM